MALSQVQCLDDNHVNPRTHESKPEFYYCEDQRHALEVLLRDGREAFDKYLEARGLRGFLSDPELEALVEAGEPYDPGSEVFLEDAEDGDPPLSLHYWPDLSDTSIPQMDLGWPDSESYRGVTRTTVYTQPPLDGQAHIKEVVRKMIAQAQKVIAVVMDVFTDVDIFRDLLDAGFKRKVSVYVLLEHTTLPHFLSMCQRANMHSGHLKHLRVRCTEGTEFYTRSCTKVKGRMGHRFMFIDGDKAVSGSYSFTWMSSRLDRNLITVVTGQAVDAFDRLFRLLYVSSSFVDLREVATQPEPEPEPLPQPAAVVLPSAALARKLHNPKYALVAVANPTPSADHNIPKELPNPENSKNLDVPETNKRRQKRASKEPIQDVPPLHPGLVDLEKACLITYLPTWPEPDPPSDVIGFINIRDAKKPTQVHLQRSEMFETSQAIRFSRPITVPKETLPEVAKPRQPIAKHEEMDKRQPTQGNSKAGESPVDSVPAQLSTEPGVSKCKEEATEQKTPVSGKKSECAKDTVVLTTENNQHSNTPISQDADRSTTPTIIKHMLPHLDMKTSSPNNQGPSCSTHTVTTNSPKPESPPEKLENHLNTQSVVDKKRTLESNSTQSPHIHANSDSTSNTEQHTQETAGLQLTNSHTQPQNPSEMPPNIQAPSIDSLISSSSTSEMCSQSVISTSLSENNHIPVTANITACTPLSSVSSSSIAAVINPSTAPSPLTPTPPIPKPRTVQLVIKYGGTSDGQNLQDISVISRTESLASTGPLVVGSKPSVENLVHTPLERERETLPKLHNRKIGPQEDSENTGNPEEAPQQKQSVASKDTKCEEAVGLCDNRAETQAQPDALITDAPKADSENIQEIIQKEADPKSLISTDCKIISKTQTDQTATIQTDTEAPEKSLTDCELAQVPSEENNNVTGQTTYRRRTRTQESRRISHCETNPQDKGPLETVNSLKASTQTPINSHMCNESADINIKPNMHDNNASQESFQQTSKLRGSSHTPERPLRLYLSDTHIRDLRSPTPERELWSLTALARTPTPDGFPSRTPTPDSRMHAPDTRSHTPDFRTPTPDVSDGYVSPREDSTLSTTSEEYYECSDSPHDPVPECVGYRNQGKTEDHVSFTHTDTPNATTITTTSTSPACINDSTHATMLGTADRNNSSSETKSLIGPAKVSSSSPVLEEKVKMREKEETVNEENGREEDEKGRNVAERRTEQDTQGTERKGNGEAKRTADHLKQGRDLTEIVEKVSQPQVTKRKKALNKSATESLVDKGVTLGAPTNEGADPKRPDSVSSEGERPDKEMVVDKAALRPSGVDERVRESGEQKQESGLSFPSRPLRPPRPLSATQTLGTRPSVYHQLIEAKSKVFHGSLQVLDKTSSHPRPLSRPPPPLSQGAVGTAAGQKQTKVSHSQHSLASPQPLAALGRARVGQSQSEPSYVKPQSSFLLTHSNIQSELRPHSQNQTVSVRKAHKQEEATSPFTITFGRLYSLKGLKDKMSKLPAQSKRGGTSSPLQGRESAS